ncbi:MAG: DUF3726 domain-containing protein [Proteobacteria bacterium]|nr:DUF3726 domain-containing protein [Pseudomonadota bacterium]
MRYSANEVEAALTKAAVAKCYPYGLATDIAAAAVLLSAYGVDGVRGALDAIVAADFSLPDNAGDAGGTGGARREVKDTADKIHLHDCRAAVLGTVAAELALATTKTVHCHCVDSPLLLAGFVALAAGRYGVSYQFNVADSCIEIPECCSLAEVAELSAGSNVLLKISATSATTPLRTTAGGVEVAAQDWQIIQMLAAQTYVAATAESRSQGAGAGEIDND